MPRPLQNILPALIAASLFLMGSAPAMDVRQFDKMAVEDQGDYVALLVQGAQKVLGDEDRNELASKVAIYLLQFFPVTSTRSARSSWKETWQFCVRLTQNTRSIIPNDPRVGVEDAMGRASYFLIRLV